MAPDNRKKLKDAKLFDDSGKLPDDIGAFLDNLSPNEVDALVSIKGKLDDAGIAVAPLKPPYQGIPIL